MASRKTSLIRVTPTNADDVTVTRSLPRTNSSRKLSRNKLSLSQTLPSNELFVRRRTSCISLPATTQSFGRKSSTAESIAERASATEPDGPKGGGDRRDSCQRRGPAGGGAGPSRRRESAALPDASALAAAGGGAKREGRRVSLNADGKMGEGGGGAGFRGREDSRSASCSDSESMEAFVMEKNVGIIPLINPSAGCLSGWEWVLLVVATWSLITAPLFACYAPAAGFAVRRRRRVDWERGRRPAARHLRVVCAC